MGQVYLRIKKADGSIDTLYEAQPKQEEFHLCPARNVLFGGSAGCGKSFSLRYDAYMRCFSMPNYRALLLRRTYGELESTHLEDVPMEAERMGARYLKSEYSVRFDNGSVLRFGHCEDDTALAKYLSTAFDAIYFDELTTFLLKQFKFISSRARTSKGGVVPMVRAGTNPGGVGAEWVKRYFIDKVVDPEEDPTYRPEDWAYIPALLDDNRHINVEEYETRLMALPNEALRQAYRWGRWDLFEGQYFSDWRALTDEGKPWHVITELPEIAGVPVTEVPWLEGFRAMDWGYRDPGVVGWYVCLPDGRLVKVKELVFKEMLAKDVAARIREVQQDFRFKIRYTVADPAMWLKDGSSAESLAETFGRNKVPLIPAENERINGWHRLHSWLRETAVVGDGVTVPMLQFYGPGCPYTVRTIPTLVVDDNKPEDVKTRNSEDHAADETRYAVMSRPAPSRTKSQKTFDPTFSVTADSRSLLREARRKARRKPWTEL